MKFMIKINDEWLSTTQADYNRVVGLAKKSDKYKTFNTGGVFLSVLNGKQIAKIIF